MVGDQLGQMLQQVGITADAVLGEQAIAVQVTDGSVEPVPGGIHHHGGAVADDLGDGHAVAHHLAGRAPGPAHGPRASLLGMSRSATAGPGWRSSPTSSATGTRCWRVAVRTTLATTCQDSAPSQVALPPHCLRHTTAGRIACSARQLVAATPGTTRK